MEEGRGERKGKNEERKWKNEESRGTIGYIIMTSYRECWFIPVLWILDRGVA
jgi:hypothetical protein